MASCSHSLTTHVLLSKFFRMTMPEKMAIIHTQKGLYRVKGLLFGVVFAPSMFKKKLWTVFFRKSLVSGKDEQDHLQTLWRTKRKLVWTCKF